MRGAGEVVQAVRGVLGPDLAAAYLADGAVVVVTAGRVEGARRAELDLLHAAAGGTWPPVVYADAADLRSPMTLGRRWPRAEAGADRLVDAAGWPNTAEGRWRLRRTATVLAGPPASDLVAEVDEVALRAEALGLARDLAERYDDERGLEPLPAPTRATRVLTACRLLHTAARAAVVDDDAAARWALAEPDVLDPRHRPTVSTALAGGEPDDAPTRDLLWDVMRLTGGSALHQRGRPDRADGR
ncbi:hypothetical protein [Nocardioides litoris]|uniref:hypothetical protein n=1 Tax=Nocardioides litoris TaxID=1926648 RepID=UPI00111F48A6|nr:hypothetical protein [Nocardioides litoris]